MVRFALHGLRLLFAALALLLILRLGMAGARLDGGALRVSAQLAPALLVLLALLLADLALLLKVHRALRRSASIPAADRR